MDDISHIDTMQDYEVWHFPDIPKIFIDLDITSRQMDILACLNSGRKAKELCLILGVAASTYSNTLNELRNKIRGQYGSLHAFIEVADAKNFLIKRFNNLQYISKLNHVLSKFKRTNILAKKVNIYYKHDIVSHYVEDLEKHLVSAGFNIDKVCLVGESILLDKDSVSIYIHSRKVYKPLPDDPEFDYIIETQATGYVTSLFNFLREYCDTKLVEEERIRHKLYIYDGVNHEYYPKDVITVLDDVKSGKYNISGEYSLLEKVVRYIVVLFKGVHNNMKSKNRLLPTVIYSAICFMFCAAVYNAYSKSENDLSIMDHKLLISSDILLERNGIIKKIHSLLGQNNSINTVILVGIGGAGKTTIAREYAKKHKTKITYEINAETTESAYNSITALAHDLIKTDDDREEWRFIESISDVKKKCQRIVNFVHAKLLDDSGRWLLVFDNVENLQSIVDMFPVSSEKCGFGKVIITTRNANIADTTLLGKVDKIEIGELTENEKKTLFEKVYFAVSKKKFAPSKGESFLKKVPSFPLDVASVAFYTSTYGISGEEYFERMRKMEGEFDSVCRTLLMDKTSYNRTRYGIVASTLNKVMEVLGDKEIYKNILFLISMCDSQDIPVKLLEKCSSSHEADRLLLELKKHSFISVYDSKISIHRSVQEFWFHILKGKIDEKSFNEFMHVFFKEAANVTKTNHLYYKMNVVQLDRGWYKSLLPHLESIIKKIDTLNISCNYKDSYISYLLFLVGTVYERQGVNIGKISDMYNKAIDLDRKVSCLPAYEKSVLLGNAGRAILFSDTNKGLELLSEAVNIALKLKDAEPLLIVNMSQLARGQIESGSFEEGMQTLNKALAACPRGNELWMEKSYVQVQSTICRMKLFNYIDKSTAKECVKECNDLLKFLKIPENLNNIKDSTQMSFFVPILKRFLAISYNYLEDYKKVKEIYADSKFIYEKFLGTSMAVYLGAQAEYGMALLRSNKFEEAEKELDKNLHYINDMGMSSSLRVCTSSCLSEVKIRLKKISDALAICLKIVSSNKKYSWNRDKLYYSSCLYNAAYASYKLNKLDDAKKYFGMFMKNINELCGRLIPEQNMKNLEADGVFSEQVDIKNYLSNAYKIYVAIFGKNHAFVKDYIYKNLQVGTSVEQR